MSSSDDIPPETPVSLQTQLDSFFVANSLAEPHLQDDTLQIKLPWNDPSLIIKVISSDNDLIDALNAVFLPPPFCALWHRDTNDIEFIAGFITDQDLINRKFDIRYDGQIVTCEWGLPSGRLDIISHAIQPVKAVKTESNYRNIGDIANGIDLQNEHPEIETVGRPLSFWLRNVAGSLEDSVRLCQHINFYMRFYDTKTPFINILEESVKQQSTTPARYLRGVFPTSLTGFKIDPYVLDLWFTALKTNDPFRKFLHSYQILEYYGFYFIKNDVTEGVRRILLKPDAISRIDEVTLQVINEMSKNNMEDVHKLRAVLRECIDPSTLWDVVAENRDMFINPINFDGGFILEALITDKATRETFSSNWHDMFGPRLESLRNHIAHAREKRHSTSISPTAANSVRLLPWAILTLRAAEEVMVYPKR